MGGDVWIQAGLYVATALLSNVIANNAAAALLFPIVLQISKQQGIDLQLLTFLLMFGASSAFMTPYGYQARRCAVDCARSPSAGGCHNAPRHNQQSLHRTAPLGRRHGSCATPEFCRPCMPLSPCSHARALQRCCGLDTSAEWRQRRDAARPAMHAPVPQGRFLRFDPAVRADQPDGAGRGRLQAHGLP